MFAIEPRTGRVLVSASWPSFNPNRAVRARSRRTGSALVNRADAGPRTRRGSSIKPVIAALALESGRANARTASSTIRATSWSTARRSRNDYAASASSARPISLFALTHSINVVSRSSAASSAAVVRAARRSPAALQRLGFYSIPPLDYPTDHQLAASGTVRPGTSTLLPPNAPIDPARTAIGQANLVATPMQMAMVAARIANGGVVMRPTLVDRVRSPSGAAALPRRNSPPQPGIQRAHGRGRDGR